MNQERSQAKKILDLKVLKKLFSFAKPYMYQFWILVFLTISLAAIVPLRPYIVGIIIDNQIASVDYEGLIHMIVLLLGLLLLQSIVQYSHTFLSGVLGQFVIKDIRIKLFRHVQSLRLKFFDQTPIGRLVTRNVSDIDASLKEAFRVLKPGGRFMCLEFSKIDNEFLDYLYRQYSKTIPFIGKLIVGSDEPYKYLIESIEKFYNQEQFAELIVDNGFSNVEYRNVSNGISSIHSGWKI